MDLDNNMSSEYLLIHFGLSRSPGVGGDLLKFLLPSTKSIMLVLRDKEPSVTRAASLVYEIHETLKYGDVCFFV